MKNTTLLPELKTPDKDRQKHTDFKFAENIIKKYQHLGIIAFCNEYALGIGKEGRAYYFVSGNGTIPGNRLAVVIVSNHKAGDWFFNAINTLGYQLCINGVYDTLSYDYNKEYTFKLN
jgi:hypothetical protein